MDEQPEVTPQDDKPEKKAAPASEPPPSELAPPQPPQQAQQTYRVTTSQSPFAKTPGLAAFLSVVPGLGNIYNGLYLRGIAFFLTYVSLFSLAVQAGDGGGRQENELAFLIPCIIFFWFFNIFDAYRQAMLINYSDEYRAEDERKKGIPASGGLVAGGIVFLVGLYGALHKYLKIDMAWLLDLWPFALMLIGGYLIWEQIKNSRQQESEAES